MSRRPVWMLLRQHRMPSFFYLIQSLVLPLASPLPQAMLFMGELRVASGPRNILFGCEIMSASEVPRFHTASGGLC